jgi:hypothetical protein
VADTTVMQTSEELASREHHGRACPRCYQRLRVAKVEGEDARAVLLACPEPYCDYVLVVSPREAFSARKWSWPDLFRFVRAAG